MNCKGKLETETRLYVAPTGSTTLKDGDKAMEHFMPEVVDRNKSSRVKKYQAVFETACPVFGVPLRTISRTKGRKRTTRRHASKKSEINRPVAIHNLYETRGEAEDELFSHPEIPMPDTTMRKLSKQFFTHELSFTAEPEL